MERLGCSPRVPLGHIARSAEIQSKTQRKTNTESPTNVESEIHGTAIHTQDLEPAAGPAQQRSGGHIVTHRALRVLLDWLGWRAGECVDLGAQRLVHVA